MIYDQCGLIWGDFGGSRGLSELGVGGGGEFCLTNGLPVGFYGSYDLMVKHFGLEKASCRLRDVRLGR